MTYRRIDSSYIIRIERGEEIVSSLLDFCEKEDIQVGEISGIGAAKNIELKYYNVEYKEYSTRMFKEEHEISTLLGNITRMGEKPYIHLHVTIGNRQFESFSGHLGTAIVSGACEVIVNSGSIPVGRVADAETGLNLLDI